MQQQSLQTVQIVGKRRREQQRLEQLREMRDQTVQIALEPETQNQISFIQDEGVEGTGFQADQPTGKMGNQPTRGADY